MNITSHPTPSGANAASAQLTLCNATRSNVRAYSVGPRFAPLPALTPYAEKLLAKAESVASAMLPAPAPAPKRARRANGRASAICIARSVSPASVALARRARLGAGAGAGSIASAMLSALASSFSA